MAPVTIPERRNFDTQAAYEAAMDAAMGVGKGERTNANNPRSTPADRAQAERAAAGAAATGASYPGLPAQDPAKAAQAAIAADVIQGQTDKQPGQTSTAGVAATVGATPGATPPEKQTQGGKPLGPTDTYDAKTPGGQAFKAVADPTYTNTPRSHVPTAAAAWYDKGGDYTADGGVNWKGTGDLKADHPDWWGEVQNYDADTQAKMLDDYKTGNEADFQDQRDDARARHMVASGWANADGSTPTDTIKNPDATGATASSAWMNNADTITGGVAETPKKETGTRTQDTQPPETTDTQTVSSGDVGGYPGRYPGAGSAANNWLTVGDPAVDGEPPQPETAQRIKMPKYY